MNLNREAIQAALALVHKLERHSRNPEGLTRPRAAEYVIKNGPKLSHVEVDILLNALHVDRTEITVQWQD